MKLFKISLLFFLLLFTTKTSFSQESEEDGRCLNADEYQADSDYEEQFINSAKAMATTFSIQVQMVDPHQRPFKFCFSKGRGNTFYRKTKDLREIRFSIDDFNESYKYVSKKDKDKSSAIISNLWILSHEYSHAIDDTLTMTFRPKEDDDKFAYSFYYMLHPFAKKLFKKLGLTIYKKSIIDTDGRYIEVNDDFSSEVFADCFGAAILAQAQKLYDYNLEDDPLYINSSLYREIAKKQRKIGIKAFLKRVVSVGNSIKEINDPHGNVDERLAFVTYGWEMASFYIDQVYKEGIGSKSSLPLSMAYVCKAYSVRAKNQNDQLKKEITDPVEFSNASVADRVGKFDTDNGY